MKRPPPNLRFDGGYLLPQELSIPLIVEAETNALLTAITHHKKQLKNLDVLINKLDQADIQLQHKVDEKIMENHHTQFDKHLQHYKWLDSKCHADWPNKFKKVAVKHGQLVKTLIETERKDPHISLSR